MKSSGFNTQVKRILIYVIPGLIVLLITTVFVQWIIPNFFNGTNLVVVMALFNSVIFGAFARPLHLVPEAWERFSTKELIKFFVLIFIATYSIINLPLIFKKDEK